MTKKLIKYDNNSDITELDALEKKGRAIYQKNEYFRGLANNLEHPEFRSFFNENFDDWTSIKTTIMFMKAYETIEKISPTQLSGYQKIAILKNWINNGEIRRELVKAINEAEKKPIQSLLSIRE